MLELYSLAQKSHRWTRCLIWTLLVFSTLHDVGRTNTAWASDHDRITVGYSHALAIKGGYVWAWGDNTYGQLGVDPNGLLYRSDPNVVDILPADIDVVCAGGFHNLALDSKGQVWSWGRNQEGQLGDGTRADRNKPQRLDTLVGIKAIAAGENVSLALDSTGRVWAWGDNRLGQVGDGFTAPFITVPKAISTAGQVLTLAAHTEHSLATTAFNVQGWGRGTERQLDHRQAMNQIVPVLLPVPEFNDMNVVAVGAFHSLGLNSSGQLWAWGQNTEGQLGDTSFVSPSEPVMTVFDPNLAVKIVSIQAGTQHSLALDANNGVWAWGDNRDGQLGNGLVSDMLATPQAVEINDVNALAVGTTYNLALDTAGVAWGWGRWFFDSNDLNDVNQPWPTVVSGFPCLVDIQSTVGGSVLLPTEEILLYRVGDRIRILAAPEEHYNFLAWTGSAVEAGWVDNPQDPNTLLQVQGDYTLRAEFQPITYSLKVTADTGGRLVLPSQSPIDVNALVPISLLTQPLPDLEGYSFDRWVLLAGGQGDFGDANNPNTTFMIRGDSEIIAVYEFVPLAGLVEPLLTVVKRALNQDTIPTQKDMLRLEELYAATKGISDLTGLEYAINVHTLDLNNNNVVDANILSQLPSLHQLFLNNNGFTNIETLTQMDQLVTLHLNDNAIADYDPFSRLKNLRHLLLNNTNDTLEDIPESWLTALKDLRVLGIYGNAGLSKSDPLVRRMHDEVCYPNGGGVYVNP